jgi:hypothetical protein
MAIGPVKDISIDYEKAKKFAARYRLTEVKENIKARHETADYSYYNYKDPWASYEPYLRYTHVRVYSMEIEGSMFAEIIDKVSELDELMQDPETARLVCEAKFIHRLKNGRI